MADFITLSCPSCGNKLQITNDIDRFACAACGNEHIVNRSGGIVTLKPILESISKVQIATDKTASELAIVRIRQEIGKLELEINDILAQQGTLIVFHIPYVFILLFFLIIGLVSILFGFLNISAGGTSDWILFIGVILFSLFCYWKGKDQRIRNEREAKPLVAKHNALKRELAEHQRIVSMNK